MDMGEWLGLGFRFQFHSYPETYLQPSHNASTLVVDGACSVKSLCYQSFSAFN